MFEKLNDVDKLFLGILVLIVVAMGAVVAYSRYDDWKHADYIGDRFVLSGDTVEVLKWRTEEPEGYVLSNGLVVDEIIVTRSQKIK